MKMNNDLIFNEVGHVSCLDYSSFVIYCVKVIIRGGGSMFVAILGNSCPRIYIPTNVYTSIYLIFNKIIPNFLPTKLLPHEPGKI